MPKKKKKMLTFLYTWTCMSIKCIYSLKVLSCPTVKTICQFVNILALFATIKIINKIIIITSIISTKVYTTYAYNNV